MHVEHFRTQSLNMYIVYIVWITEHFNLNCTQWKFNKLISAFETKVRYVLVIRCMQIQRQWTRYACTIQIINYPYANSERSWNGMCVNERASVEIASGVLDYRTTEIIITEQNRFNSKSMQMHSISMRTLQTINYSDESANVFCENRLSDGMELLECSACKT